MRKHGRIYALADPETRAIRYVGQTRHSVEARMNGHLAGARGPKPTRCGVWLRTLPTEPLVITLEDQIPLETLDDRERYWIDVMKNRGCDLTNSTPGGSGWSPEAGRLGGLALTGVPKSPEHREALAESQRGRTRVVSAETRAKISAARKGKPMNHKPGCTCSMHDGQAGARARWGSDH
jgi:hypothetical protein